MLMDSAMVISMVGIKNLVNCWLYNITFSFQYAFLQYSSQTYIRRLLSQPFAHSLRGKRPKSWGINFPMI